MGMPVILKETPRPWNGRRVTAYQLDGGAVGIEVTRFTGPGYGCPWTITHTRTIQPGAWSPNTRVFNSPYDQHAARNGETCTILSTIDTPDSTHDAEVLPMYQVQFSDGATLEAWPEEITNTEGTHHD